MHMQTVKRLMERVETLEQENVSLARTIQETGQNEGNSEDTAKVSELIEALDAKEKEVIDLKGELYKSQE